MDSTPLFTCALWASCCQACSLPSCRKREEGTWNKEKSRANESLCIVTQARSTERERLERSSGFFPRIELLNLIERNSKREAAFTFRLEIKERAFFRRSRRAQNSDSPFADRTCVANARDLVLHKSLLWFAINYRLPGGKSIDKTIYSALFWTLSLEQPTRTRKSNSAKYLRLR